MRKADFQSLLIFIKSFYLFFRTDTLLEIFEDAPDDNANWGEVVDTEKKFYNTSTSESSSGSSDENGKKENNLDVKPVRSLNSLSAKNPKNINMPAISRAQSARALRSHHEVQREIVELKGQLDRVEEKRHNDIDRLENQLVESNKKIESMLQQLLGQQQKTKPNTRPNTKK